MNAQRYQLVKRIFLDVCQAEPSARGDLLQRMCGEDRDLRTEVESLLNSDNLTGSFLQSPLTSDWFADFADSAAHHEGAAAPSRPEHIGAYRILDVLGEGGMGVVYLAEQENPRRPVALKVIRPAFATAQMLRRFEFEAHVLARLHHPGIAQVYEAGSAPIGAEGAASQPYFAMELVEGLPLNAYAAKHDPSLRQRIELLISVCEAVHHAHQKGVIHRDLKPANILVNDAGQPKVLDFGVARLIEGTAFAAIRESAGQSNSDGPRAGHALSHPAGAMHTIPGQLVGTVAYMSPEHLGAAVETDQEAEPGSGRNGDIDTRADVYALGVIAYELISGRPPHDLRDRTIGQCARIILEQPIAPLGAIDKRLRGDLEIIIAKALEKQRDRRYQSALELGQDLGRFLRDEPITARPASAGYRMRKFVRRHRALVALSAAAALAVLIGGAGIAWQAASARAAWAYMQQHAAMLQSTLERRLQAREGDDPIKPQLGDENELQEIAQWVQHNLADRPDGAIQAARLQDLIGQNYLALADLDQAYAHIAEGFRLREGAHPQGHPDTAASLHSMGRVLFAMQQTEEAKRAYDEALALRSRFNVDGRLDADVAQTLKHLAACERREGAYDRCRERLDQALAIFQRLGVTREVAACMNNLGICLMDQRLPGEAAEVLGQALTTIQQIAKPGDLRIARGKQNLAAALIEAADPDDLDQAQALLRDALDAKSSELSPRHPDIAATLYWQARLLHAQGRGEAARAACEQALAIQRERRAGQTDLADTLVLHGILVASADELLAEHDLREALAIYERKGLARHWRAGEASSILGERLAATGHVDEAETLLLEGFDILSAGDSGPEHGSPSAVNRGWGSRASAAQRLVRFYEAINQPAKAERYRLYIQRP